MQPPADNTPTPLQKIWVELCILYPLVVLLSITATNILLVFIVLGAILFYSRILTPRARLPLYILGLYLTWTLIAVALSPISSNWGDWAVERSTFLAIIPGLALGSNPQWLRKSLRYLSILLILLAVYAIYQYYLGWDVLRGKPLEPLLNQYHAIGLQDFHLTFAGLMALALPVAVSAHSPRPLQSSIVALAGVLAVLASMARAITLGLYGGAALFLIFGSRRLKIAGIVLIFALILIPGTIFSASGERMLRGFGMAGTEAQQGDPTRTYLWKSAVNIIRHYPLTGVGENNWGSAFEKYGVPYDNYSSTAHAHNDFLTSAVENGLTGGAILAFLWGYILFRAIRSIFRSEGQERDLRLGFLAAFLIILFGGMLQNYQTDAEVALMLWFLVGISVQLPERG